MEPEITLDSLLSLTQSLITLSDSFRTKDKWFDICKTYLISVLETMEKYKSTHDPSKKIPDVCLFLKGELENFRDFLEKEKNRSSFSSFFRGTSLVKQAQESFRGIEGQIHNFNIVLNQEVNGLQKMQSLCLGSPSLKSEFVNTAAADFWVLHFFQDPQVSWGAFAVAFRKFCLQTEKFELNDDQMEKILETIDGDHDRLIRYEECDMFWGQFWATPAREILLKSKPMQEPISKINVPPIVLKVVAINDEDPKIYNYPKDHEFLISQETVNFINPDGKQISNKKNWNREGLIIGRARLGGTYVPDIYFHSKIASVMEKQCQIVLKKTAKSEGFFLNNLSSGSPTGLRIGKIPFIISVGMLFELSGNILEVLELSHLPDFNALDEDNPGLFVICLDAKPENPDQQTTLKRKPGARKGNNKEEEEGKGNRKMPLKKGKVIPPTIKLKVLLGADAGKELDFVAKGAKDEKIIKVGSEEGCEARIEGLAPVQMMIRWDAFLKLWVACSENTKGPGSYLYLISAEDYTSRGMTAGRVSVLLRDGMVVAFGGNEVEVIIK